MNSELSKLIANLVIEADPELEVRLQRQDEALNESACTAPVLGKWIDAHDIEYLLASFSLSDEDFAQMFPSMPNIPSHIRRQIVTVFEEHLKVCRHCSLKVAYVLELNTRIDRVCLENRHRLLQSFENDKHAAMDEEHCGKYWLSNPVWALAFA